MFKILMEERGNPSCIQYKGQQLNNGHVCSLLVEYAKQVKNMKVSLENDMVEYHMLMFANPLDNYYKIGEEVLSLFYQECFGDEEYGKYLANYHSLIKQKEENFKTEVCCECKYYQNCDDNADERKLINCMLKEPLWED